MAGGELQDYEVEVNGMKTVLRLTEEDAKARGLTGGSADSPPEPVSGEKMAEPPANKSRTAANK